MGLSAEVRTDGGKVTVDLFGNGNRGGPRGEEEKEELLHRAGGEYKVGMPPDNLSEQSAKEKAEYHADRARLALRTLGIPERGHSEQLRETADRLRDTPPVHP